MKDPSIKPLPSDLPASVHGKLKWFDSAVLRGKKCGGRKTGKQTSQLIRKQKDSRAFLQKLPRKSEFLKGGDVITVTAHTLEYLFVTFPLTKLLEFCPETGLSPSLPPNSSPSFC